MEQEDSKESTSEEPNFEEFICPICLDLLLEPVTLPCHHSLCISCFRDDMELAKMECAICRRRFSNWARRAANDKKLVDQEKWAFIQVHFPAQLLLRQQSDGYCKLKTSKAEPRRLSAPGEIRHEYEEEMNKIKAEQDREEELSNALISRLQREETLVVTNDRSSMTSAITTVAESEVERQLKEMRRDDERQTHVYSRYKPLTADGHTATDEPTRSTDNSVDSGDNDVASMRPSTSFIVHTTPDEIFGYEPDEKPTHDQDQPCTSTKSDTRTTTTNDSGEGRLTSEGHGVSDKPSSSTLSEKQIKSDEHLARSLQSAYNKWLKVERGVDVDKYNFRRRTRQNAEQRQEPDNAANKKRRTC